MDLNTGIMGYPLNKSINDLQSKADAIKYAIEFTEIVELHGSNRVNYDAAQELFDFICKNVNLPDVRPNPADGLVEFAKEYIEKLAKDK
ncbi:MAG: hypothetical protein J6V00_07790 [Bacteroidaceae bacterium]|nr:hypothetical protein [Bacteroidaceae bacterium]